MAASITPAERKALIDGAKAEGRKEALEEAAKVLRDAERTFTIWDDYTAGVASGIGNAADTVENMA